MDVRYDSGLTYDSGLRYDTPAPPSQSKKMSKPKLNLKDLSFEEILTLATAIRTKMTGNAAFLTPLPTLAELGTMTTAAQTAFNESVAARDTAKAKTAACAEAFETLCAALTQEAGYVEAVSGGDAAKILSAGMDVRADRTAPTVPGQVLNLVLSEGDFPGSLDFMCAPEPQAKTYELQTSPDPMTETSWVYRDSVTKSSGTLNGMTSGLRVWVRLRAVGAGGKGPWSDPAVKTVP